MYRLYLLYSITFCTIAYAPVEWPPTIQENYADECEDFHRWPGYFRDLWYIQNQPLDKEAILNHPHNIFWKNIYLTASQETKDKYLRAAISLRFIQEESYKKAAIACALAAGANPNQRYERSNWSLLQMLTESNWYYLTQLALECGANTNEPTASLLYVVRDRKMAELLINYKADINQKDVYSGATVLFKASDSLISPDLLNYYLKQKADVNIKNDFGKTALFHAACATNSYYNIKKVELLLHAGAMTDDVFWRCVPKHRSEQELQEIRNIIQQCESMP